MAENQHITDALNFYLDKNHKTHHALMLTGEWGCGKTHYIMDIIDYIKSLTPFESYQRGWDNCALHQSHYISLYGIESLKDLQRQLFAEFYPIKRIRNTISNFISTTARAGASASIPYFDKLSLTLSIKPENIKNIFSKAFNNLKEAAIIFDDLERCAIPVEALFGFINQLVEHNGQKVILIANEDKLIENTAEQNLDHKKSYDYDDIKEKIIKSNGQEAILIVNQIKFTKQESNGKKTHTYAEIKEKLVGTTLELQTSAAAVLDHFIAEMEEGKARDCAEQNKAYILDIFTKLKINNYRSLRQTLYDFSCLLSEVAKALKDTKIKIMEDTENTSEARRQLLILVLVMDMQYRRHDKDKDANLQDLLTYTQTELSSREQVQVARLAYDEAYGRISKYTSLEKSSPDLGHSPILQLDIIAHYLLTGSADSEGIRTYLMDSPLFRVAKQIPAWLKFGEAVNFGLNVQEFKESLARITNELEHKELRDIIIVLYIASCFIKLQKAGEELPAFMSPDAESYFSSYLKDIKIYPTDYKLSNRMGRGFTSKQRNHMSYSFPQKGCYPVFESLFIM